MAHFAELDENNIVKRVILISNDDIINENGEEDEILGIEICKKITQSPNSTWIQTSYNNKMRNKYAGIGDVYLENINSFICPQPYSSWSLDEENLQWDPPVSYPENYSELTHYWDEENKQWSLFE